MSDDEYEITVPDGDDIESDASDYEADVENDEPDEIDIETVVNLTKYEFPVVLSTRIMQIDRGSKVFINEPEKYGDSYEIALEEFKRNLLPFIIKRPINRDKGIYQRIKLEDLYHPLKY